MFRYTSSDRRTQVSPDDSSSTQDSISMEALTVKTDDTGKDTVDFIRLESSTQSPNEIRYKKANFFRGTFDNMVDGVKQVVEFPFVDRESDKQAHDTLAGLEPFFWLLRGLGLCPRVALFDTEGSHQSHATKIWNYGLLTYTVIVGIFLWLGFVVTFGFSLAWPLAFCAGFQSIMYENATYCKTDLMARFLTLKGMNTLTQTCFLFIGAVNMVVAVTATIRIGPIVKILRKYYEITPALKVATHRRIAIIHAVITVLVAAAIGIPYTFVYEDMLNEIKTEHSYEGYPFASIDTPLVKIENWIAYTKQNSTDSKTEKYALTSIKYVFRAQNFFSFLSCFAVPFFFSLMCDLVRKEWRRFVAYLELDTTRASLSPSLLRNVRSCHWLLCQLLGTIDECFSFMTLVIYMTFIVINSSIIYAVLKFGTKASGQDRYAFYQAIMMFIALGIIFYLVIRQAMKIHVITGEAVVKIRNWQPTMDGILDNEYLLLINQVTTTDSSFTAWNCFRIENAAYVNALAIIFGYVLMMLQYQPPGSAGS